MDCSHHDLRGYGLYTMLTYPDNGLKQYSNDPLSNAWLRLCQYIILVPYFIFSLRQRGCSILLSANCVGGRACNVEGNKVKKEHAESCVLSL